MANDTISSTGASETTISSQVYLSRDNTREQIANHLKTYLELENVDLTKSSFLSFIVNIISTLTGNMMFYQISAYREFFLTTAQLDESIFNLSAFLGYNTKEAVYSVGNVLITIPFGFPDATTTFTIPENFVFKAQEIEFIAYYRTDITVLNNQNVGVKVTEGSNIYNLPVVVDTTANFNFSFVLPLRQYKDTVQEFQVDEDLKTYQFSTIDVPVEGKVAGQIVEVRDPGSSGFDLWTEFESLYLMSSTDKGYVSRRTGFGRRLYFGNGLMGVQPIPGSTIRVTVQETDGADGNVIAGSIKSGERVYNIADSGIQQIVNYAVTNPSPATGGEDEEDVEDIRSNAIANIKSLGRLVTYDDYTHTDVVLTSTDEDLVSPIAPNSIAILKRSDIKVNEIMLFTTLLYGTENGTTEDDTLTVVDQLVPMRNAWFSVDSTSPITTVYIERGTVIPIDGVDYYTLFDISTDNIYNRAAYYHYIMDEISQNPLLVTGYGVEYNLVATTLSVQRSGSQAIFRLLYSTTEVDYSTTTCEMKILQDSSTYAMVNDSINQYYEVIIDPYTLLPEDTLTIQFTLSTVTETFARYENELVFRQSLDDFMISNLTANDATSPTQITIYDVPVIQAEYYDGIDQANFELVVLQNMLATMDFVDYRMLTDFTNLKFAHTTGTMSGMQRNEVTKFPVIDIGLTSVPVAPSLGDRYIVTGFEGGAWEGHKDDIAECSDATSVTWIFTEPITDDILNVTNKGVKYIYTGVGGWVVPIYEIPLQLEMEVHRDPLYPDSATQLSNDIKTALIVAFTDRFGVNATIYRSEIIDIVQEIFGVSHVALLKPESNIFFVFEPYKDFTQQELLEYGPEYIFFTEDDISIAIYG